VPPLLSGALAVFAVLGAIAIAVATDGGTAPGSGQRAFDSPGCQPLLYDGPSTKPVGEIGRGCPTPTAVVLSTVAAEAAGWRVTWDASRSYDAIGGRLVSFRWRLEDGSERSGRRLVVRYRKAGSHRVFLQVTDDVGARGTAYGSVDLR
jgi:hypothetical protein